MVFIFSRGITGTTEVAADCTCFDATNHNSHMHPAPLTDTPTPSQQNHNSHCGQPTQQRPPPPAPSVSQQQQSIPTHQGHSGQLAVEAVERQSNAFVPIGRPLPHFSVAIMRVATADDQELLTDKALGTAPSLDLQQQDLVHLVRNFAVGD